jgi:hypothetical protein
VSLLTCVIPSADPRHLRQTVDGSIYLITCLVNGKQYVGQTIQPVEKRWRGHTSDTRRGFTYPICNAIRKHGDKNFQVEVIDTADTLDRLNELEQFYIALHGTLKPNGYNLQTGGLNHRTHPETKKKIGAANTGNQNSKGRVLSEETKAKMGAANRGNQVARGAVRSPETRAKISAAKKGKPGHWKGKHLPPEAIAKMSAAFKGKPGTPHTDEWKEKHSERMKGNKYGSKPKSPEHRAKIREGNLRRWARARAAANE